MYTHTYIHVYERARTCTHVARFSPTNSHMSDCQEQPLCILRERWPGPSQEQPLSSGPARHPCSTMPQSACACAAAALSAARAPASTPAVRALDAMFERVVESIRADGSLADEIDDARRAVGALFDAMAGVEGRRAEREEGVVRPRRAPRARKKRYHDATPSTHCHVCCRPSSAVPMAVCANIREGMCRKVVCNRCMAEYGWDWDNAVAADTRWVCPHCADSCANVPRAQCHTYQRTNSRRKSNGGKNKKPKTDASGASSGAPANAVTTPGSTSACLPARMPFALNVGNTTANAVPSAHFSGALGTTAARGAQCFKPEPVSVSPRAFSGVGAGHRSNSPSFSPPPTEQHQK